MKHNTSSGYRLINIVRPALYTLIRTILFAHISLTLFAQEKATVIPGPDQNTPSKSHYFDWINSQYEGTSEIQTMTNMNFFQWLHDEYGMTLDIYSLDVGNIDDGPYTAGVGRLIPYHYGTMKYGEFKIQFPNGFTPLVKKAVEFGGRLGVWMGPDGFGTTPEEEQARVDMLISLCRDYNFIAFKVDAVAGQIRPEKQKVFMQAINTCRTFCPDLIVQSHRVNFGIAESVVTTSLWEGVETYIDVFMPNDRTAIHHRAGALMRELPPDLTRRLEDHGVCLSSCLDFWEDDLVLQAFNRGLLLAPSVYGNPWFLRDDEFPKLARIFNLHRRNKNILVQGMVLPENRYGPFAASRGNDTTRFITLRNLTWNNVTYTVHLDETIGLKGSGNVEVRRLHPSESIVGTFPRGSSVDIEVLPFRSCLVLASSQPIPEIGIQGCDYEIIRDTPGKPVIVSLLGMPGSKAEVSLRPGTHRFTNATIDGANLNSLVRGKTITVNFPGNPLRSAWHRKIGELARCPVPPDAEALYEATCYAADNNALEVRSIMRSEPSQIPEVRAARKAFFEKPMFVNRGIWDRNLFDGNLNTFFIARLKDQTLRVDFGELLYIDKVVIRIRDRQEYDQNPELHTFAADAVAEVSSDLQQWSRLDSTWRGKGTIAILKLPSDKPVRYLRIHGAPQRIAEIEAYHDGKILDRYKWRASNLFPAYFRKKAEGAWRLSFTLKEIPRNAYLAVAVNGKHGNEGAYAALRVEGKPIGAPDRAVSFPSNTWEYFNAEQDSNYTYFFPLSGSIGGKKIELVVLILKGGTNDVKPEVWLTAYPVPYERHELVLNDNN